MRRPRYNDPFTRAARQIDALFPETKHFFGVTPEMPEDDPYWHLDGPGEEDEEDG